jgi:hypothetical protein
MLKSLSKILFHCFAQIISDFMSSEAKKQLIIEKYVKERYRKNRINNNRILPGALGF